jgi:hypothetical protein
MAKVAQDPDAYFGNEDGLDFWQQAASTAHASKPCNLDPITLEAIPPNRVIKLQTDQMGPDGAIRRLSICFDALNLYEHVWAAEQSKRPILNPLSGQAFSAAQIKRIKEFAFDDASVTELNARLLAPVPSRAMSFGASARGIRTGSQGSRRGSDSSSSSSSSSSSCSACSTPTSSASSATTPLLSSRRGGSSSRSTLLQSKLPPPDRFDWHDFPSHLQPAPKIGFPAAVARGQERERWQHLLKDALKSLDKQIKANPDGPYVMPTVVSIPKKFLKKKFEVKSQNDIDEYTDSILQQKALNRMIATFIYTYYPDLEFVD